jgi:ATP-dependent DNA ligase
MKLFSGDDKVELSEKLFMLAEHGDIKSVPLPCYAEPKYLGSQRGLRYGRYDGVRTFAEIKDGEPTRFVNRRGHLIHDRTPFHRAALFAIKGVLTNAKTSAILDGELWGINPQGKPLDFYEVLRIDKGDLIEAGRCQPRYTVFDVLEYNEKDLRSYPYFTRITMLDMMLKKGEIVSPVERILVKTQDDIANTFNSMLAAGYEGIMLKQPFTPYESGRRSKNWFKVKPVSEVDVVVIGVKPMKDYADRIGAVSIAAYDENNNLVDLGFCNVPLDRDTPVEQMLLQPLTVRYQSVIEDVLTHGIKLRFPTFKTWRLDKKKEDCRLSQLKR